MGQKVNPNIIRIGVIRDWNSKWYATKRNYAKLLHQDLEIEKLIEKDLTEAGISHLEIQRTANQVIINIHTAKPGLIIGRGGTAIEKLRDKLNKKFDDRFEINIREVKNPALSAKIVGEGVARQVEKRISYRRAAKMAIDKAIEAGALGAKILLSGRLNGVEIARTEFFSKGKIPLHTFRADIDYALVPAHTTYGIIGIKVWIYKGEIFKKKKEEPVEEPREEKEPKKTTKKAEK
ncbi:MAG: 30S ribosomal protein S3 [Patescibacteria group bacterium]|nr:30S ribosomal protein S3 [Patescibacteria group bacterium]